MNRLSTSLSILSVIGLAHTAQADVFETDFIGATVTPSSGAHIFGDTAPAVSGTLVSGNQGGANVIVDAVAGTVGLGTTPNSRGLAAFISLDGVAAGDYSFDAVVDSFNDAGPQNAGTRLFLVSGIDADSGVSLDVHAGGGGTVTPTTSFVPLAVGTDAASVSITQVGTELAITDAGTFSNAFSLANDGAAGDFLVAIAFRDGNATGGNNAILSSIAVNAVPEPASLALMGLAGLCLVSRRRK